MLQNTFVHVPGIGDTTEQALWRSGCRDWACALAPDAAYSYGNAARDEVHRYLERSQSALMDGRFQFFRQSLGQREAWRAYPEFVHNVVYLDIETDGGQSGDSVTTIGMYDGNEFQCLVKGQDLENFRDIISGYSMIVTFFGAGFDLPMLQKRFRGLQFDQIHIDLCPTLRRLGLKGGLKKIEKELGIARGDDTDGLNGYDAVLLWRRYTQLRDEAALEKLIAYNREDVVNLKTLAEHAYRELRAQVFDAELAAT